MRPYLQVGGKNESVCCGFCDKKIALEFRVSCCDPVCQPQNIKEGEFCLPLQLCGDCFSAGVNVYPHVNTHSYTIPDYLGVPLFTKDWTINEELLLLEGIDKFGFGNWKTIADYISFKTAKQVEEHYNELYLGLHGYCLPQKTIKEDKVVNTFELLTNSLSNQIDDMKINEDENGQNALGLHLIPVTKSFNRGDVVQRDIGKETGKGRERQDVIRERLAQLPGSDLPGFVPLREDFDVEYDNDAELPLADMEFNPEDHPTERELKLQIIRIYNSKLEERNRRKRFVIDRGLIDIKNQLQIERRRPKEDRDLVAKLRLYARFQSKEDHETLIEGMLKARQLAIRIDLYKTYREMGIRTLEQARQYELDRKRQEKELKARSHRDASSYLFETGRTSFPSSDGLSLSRRGTGLSSSTLHINQTTDSLLVIPSTTTNDNVREEGNPTKRGRKAKVDNNNSSEADPNTQTDQNNNNNNDTNLNSNQPRKSSRMNPTSEEPAVALTRAIRSKSSVTTESILSVVGAKTNDKVMLSNILQSS
eukprot:gene4953-6926_t